MATSDQPKFPWDYDVPNTPFWADLDFTAGRNFLKCFTPDEVEKMNFATSDTLPKEQKLDLLLRYLQERLCARESEVAPLKLGQLDSMEWEKYMLGILTIQRFLNLPDEERTLQMMLDAVEGGHRMPWLNMLASYKLRNGKYAEAERIEREVLPWMETHILLGKDSPQALGTRRIIIEALWLQGRENDAKEFIEETWQLVDVLPSSKFAKYEKDERQILRDLVAKLRAGN